MDGSLTPLQFPVAAPPRPGEALAIASGVRCLRMPLSFTLDHINLWLLEDGPGWTIDQHQMGFALGEALAHLNQLMYQGALIRESDEDGVYRFHKSAAPHP